MMPTMTFYVTRGRDGNVHVQNAVSGLLGQHHVHTPEGFERWRKGSDDIHELDGGPCGCGLEPGQARDGDGRHGGERAGQRVIDLPPEHA